MSPFAVFIGVFVGLGSAAVLIDKLLRGKLPAGVSLLTVLILIETVLVSLLYTHTGDVGFLKELLRAFFRGSGIYLFCLGTNRNTQFYGNAIVMVAGVAGHLLFQLNELTVQRALIGIGCTLAVLIYMLLVYRKKGIQPTNPEEQKNQSVIMKYPRFAEVTVLFMIVFCVLVQMMRYLGYFSFVYTYVPVLIVVMLAGIIGMSATEQNGEGFPGFCWIYGFLLTFSSAFSVIPVYTTIIIVIQCVLAGVLWFFLRQIR